MTNKTKTETVPQFDVLRAFFSDPRFMGWMGRPCSQCGIPHPSHCEIVKDPDYQEALAKYKTE